MPSLVCNLICNGTNKLRGNSNYPIHALPKLYLFEFFPQS